MGRTWNTPRVHLESGGGGGYGAPPVHLFAADDATHTPYCGMLQIEKRNRKANGNRNTSTIQNRNTNENTNRNAKKEEIQMQIYIEIEMQIDT